MATLVHAAPILSNTTDTNTLHNRGLSLVAYFGPGIEFTTCMSSDDPHMCTVFFVQNPNNWGPYRRILLYDNACTNKLGFAQSVSRHALARPGEPCGKTMGWLFEGAKLANPLYVYVSADWDATNAHGTAVNMGVGVVYNGVVSNPLFDNKWSLADWTNLYAEGSGT
ncbi:uncharacterized protein PAC_08321 [Phialocephala subalpina]|uniref:Uncharacterized protein n=1 Tax=Phialocephala subalpina TaxID=576137 RepID=A0A1L7X077_9HELO|nr:uncharacterized protein PAC_08321 [Phialocephala subalpina]